MKNTIILLIVSLLFITIACDDDEEIKSYEEQLAIDIDIIQNYLEDHYLPVQSTEDGLHYIIHSEGTGSSPTADSTVTVKYSGRLLNNKTFDSGIATFELKDLILGWRKGLPLLKEGAIAVFYVPSSMGYGVYGANGIPGNSVLIFAIELQDVSN